MLIETIVCDQCHQPPKRIFREYEQRIFCRLECWLEFWTKDWQHWMDGQYSVKPKPTVIRKSA